MNIHPKLIYPKFISPTIKICLKFILLYIIFFLGIQMVKGAKLEICSFILFAQKLSDTIKLLCLVYYLLQNACW